MLGCEDCLSYPICTNEDKGTRCDAYEKAPEPKTCCICGHIFFGWGNNPYPIKEDGECCDKCNNLYVTPERIRRAYSKRGE